MTKEILIFLSIIFLGIAVSINLNIAKTLIIYFSAVFIYLILKNKNRHIGIPALAATFSVLVFIYIFGVIGNCHLCKTNDHGIIFFCNRIVNLAPLNYENQLNTDACIQELIWIWPKQN
tara:strand:+ start:129 stop:485 length:357 start_codon:yes stop_codon:yes gene_type:complete